MDLTVHQKAKFWRLLVKICKKSVVKHCRENPILLNFVNLSPNFCPRLYLLKCKIYFGLLSIKSLIYWFPLKPHIGVNYSYFKLYWFNPPQIFYRRKRMRISIRPDGLFQLIATPCIRINLINLPKQLFIITSWTFTRNRPCHRLKLTENSFIESGAESFTTINIEDVKLY